MAEVPYGALLVFALFFLVLVLTALPRSSLPPPGSITTDPGQIKALVDDIVHSASEARQARNSVFVVESAATTVAKIRALVMLVPPGSLAQFLTFDLAALSQEMLGLVRSHAQQLSSHYPYLQQDAHTTVPSSPLPGFFAQPPPQIAHPQPPAEPTVVGLAMPPPTRFESWT